MKTATITLVGTALSVLVTIIYGLWFVTSIEKRVSLLEQSHLEFKSHNVNYNDSQDKAILRLQDKTTEQIDRIEDKIEKIYLIIQE